MKVVAHQETMCRAGQDTLQTGEAVRFTGGISKGAVENYVEAVSAGQMLLYQPETVTCFVLFGQ